MKDLTLRDLIQAQLNGTTVQYWTESGGGSWVDFIGTMRVAIVSLDCVADSRKWRIKPPKPRICNGVELDPCLTEHPKQGTYYYFPDPTRVGCYSNRTLWAGDSMDRLWFDQGFVYATAEAASKHGRAMGLYSEGSDER